MSENTEIEAKVVLPQDIYRKVLAGFASKSSFDQVNYYFDTDSGLLKEANVSCRIRLFADHGEQTLKVPNTSPVQANYHEAIEINDALTLAAARHLVDQAQTHPDFNFHGTVGSYLNAHFGPAISLRLQTYSKTHRSLLRGPHGCELTLDDTVYPDGYEDFELEIENSQLALIKG
ncbi:CYTH domain-containing protein, partial [Lactobacillus sp. XV13L]|nr:CYTH domain-containing protein [Lactobacillus sp. XV13L]